MWKIKREGKREGCCYQVGERKRRVLTVGSIWETGHARHHTSGRLQELAWAHRQPSDTYHSLNRPGWVRILGNCRNAVVDWVSPTRSRTTTYQHADIRSIRSMLWQQNKTTLQLIRSSTCRIIDGTRHIRECFDGSKGLLVENTRFVVVSDEDTSAVRSRNSRYTVVLEYPLVVPVVFTPVAGRSSKVGSSASLLPISPPTIIKEPFAICMIVGYQRGTSNRQ
jgi:hypothetical protein